ncbi:uncharacterized protein LOC107265149 isoform X1 [Cephus cinctus]|uniref:Uncharacterized protein LOC107265149 isoform X1 n=1 Tax=Cephus cinctus TaxID=211228 RepID=A0AAJ7FFU8_CEPCN|nr:uncharacterized protein LOC107265149 isoform X1 [Cephus cinctus]
MNTMTFVIRILMILTISAFARGDFLMGGHLDNKDSSSVTKTNNENGVLSGIADLDLDLTAEESAASPTALIPDGLPRYRIPGLFAFNGGKPFSLEKDPITGKIDFEKAPPLKALNYTEYEGEEEEDAELDANEDNISKNNDNLYKKNIDRKDNPNTRPNEINPYSPSFHDFLNLPVHYTSDKYSKEKYPLISSSYANTKVQSGLKSYNTYNHRTYPEPTKKPALYFTTHATYLPKTTTTKQPPTMSSSTETTTVKSTSAPTSTHTRPTTTTVSTTTTTTTTTTTPPPTTTVSTTRTTKPTTTVPPRVTTWKPSTTIRVTDEESHDYEDEILPFKPMPDYGKKPSSASQGSQSIPKPQFGGSFFMGDEYDDGYDYDISEEGNQDYTHTKDKMNPPSQTSPSVTTFLSSSTFPTTSTTTSTTSAPSTTITSTTFQSLSATPGVSTPVMDEPTRRNDTTDVKDDIEEEKEVPLKKPVMEVMGQIPVTSLPLGVNHPPKPIYENSKGRPYVSFGNAKPMEDSVPNLDQGLSYQNGLHRRPVESASNVIVPPDQDTVSFVLGNKQNVDGGHYIGTAIRENPYGTKNEAPFRPIFSGVAQVNRPGQGNRQTVFMQNPPVALPSVASSESKPPAVPSQQWQTPPEATQKLSIVNEIEPSNPGQGTLSSFSGIRVPSQEQQAPLDNSWNVPDNTVFYDKLQETQQKQQQHLQQQQQHLQQQQQQQQQHLQQKQQQDLQQQHLQQQQQQQYQQQQQKQQYEQQQYQQQQQQYLQQQQLLNESENTEQNKENQEVENEEYDTKRVGVNSGYVVFPGKTQDGPVEEHVIIINESDGSVQELPPTMKGTLSTPAAASNGLPQLSESLTPPEVPKPGSSFEPPRGRPPYYSAIRQRIPPHSKPSTSDSFKRPLPYDPNLPNILPQFRPNAKTSHGHRGAELIGTIPARPPYGPPSRPRQPLLSRTPPPPAPPPPPPYLQRLSPPPPPIHALRLSSSSPSTVIDREGSSEQDVPFKRFRVPPANLGQSDRFQDSRIVGQKLRLEGQQTGERFSAEPPLIPPRPIMTNRRSDVPRIATLQMIQQRGGLEERIVRPNMPPPFKVNFDTDKGDKEDDEIESELGPDNETNGDVSSTEEDTDHRRPVYVVYPVNSAVNIQNDDSQDKDESVVVGTRGPNRPLPPDTLPVAEEDSDDDHNTDYAPVLPPRRHYPGPAIASDFPYPLERPDPSFLNVRETPLLVPSKDPKTSTKEPAESSSEIKDDDRDTSVNVIPYLQDYVPFSAKKSDSVISATLHRSPVSTMVTPIAYAYTPTIKASPYPTSEIHVEDKDMDKKAVLPSQQPSSSSSSAPSPQNFMAPFMASLSAEAPSKNGWSVVVKPGSTERNRSDTDKEAESRDTTENETQTEKTEFDPENFKPQLFGGFKPIYEFPVDDAERDAATMPATRTES